MDFLRCFLGVKFKLVIGWIYVNPHCMDMGQDVLWPAIHPCSARSSGCWRHEAGSQCFDAEPGHTRPVVDTTKEPAHHKEGVGGHQGNQEKKKKRQSKMHHDRKEGHSAALDKTPFPVVCIVVFHHILPPSEWRCLFSHRFLTFSAKSSGPGGTEDTVNKDSSAYCLNPTRSTSKC